MATPTATGWVHALSKEELVKALTERELPVEGKRDELRARLLEHVRNAKGLPPSDSEDDSQDDEEEDVKDQPTGKAKKRLAETATVLDTVRKWGCQFDGKDGVAFLERLEDLRLSYGMTPEQLRPCLPLLFRDSALLWYRNNRDDWQNWNDFETCFRQYYVPAESEFELEEAIAGRKQGPGETAREYTTALQTLMRRHGHMTPASRLERTYHNLRPEYHLYIRRADFRTIAELLQRADEYERARRYEQRYQASCSTNKTAKPRTGPDAHTAAISPGYNPQDCCWGCGQRGHVRRFCRRPPKLFCSQCGKEGVLTRDCHGTRAGNTGRAEEKSGTPRPTDEAGTASGS